VWTSDKGAAAIERREGRKLKAYQDGAGVWTIGVGHTAAAGDPRPHEGMTITDQECSEILKRDLKPVEHTVMRTMVTPVYDELTQNQWDALVSLVFNIGGGAYQKSTLLKLLNEGDIMGAADQFLVWDKITVNGKKQTSKGLHNRRVDEREQFLS
jgi:lysozyme